MARGASSKEKLFKELLKMFPGSFMQDAKTIRIPFEEDGNIIELKIAPTAAKDILGKVTSSSQLTASSVTDGGTAGGDMDWSDPEPEPEPNIPAEPTEEEKKTLETLIDALGL